MPSTPAETRRRDRRSTSKSTRIALLEDVEGLQDQRKRDLQELMDLLMESGNGSVLRAWRSELDPSGMLEVDIQEFCKAVKRLGWSGDPRLLVGEETAFGSRSIEDILPLTGQLLIRFQIWVKEVFQTPAKMFAAFDASGIGTVTRERFFTSCRDRGFQASDQELGEIFDCCDWGETGSIVQDDVVYLETDREARDLELLKAKSLNMREWRHQIAQDYLDQFRRLPSDAQLKHRLAPRPWQAKTFEQLPTIACQQRNDRRRTTRHREMQAKEAFLSHLREIYGSEVRALRRSLDTDGSFGFTQLTLRFYCRKVDLDINPKDLWRSLDRDGDGLVTLPELCMKPALALARFQRWAIGTLTSCTAIWDTPEAATARARTQRGAWGSEKKMLFASFAEALRLLDWPQVNDHNERSLVFSSLDSYGCGLIMRSELEWLDKWKPPEWLHADPDHEAWSNLKGLLVRMYRHPLHAWRRLLDRDSCGQIRWPDFKAACTKLRFRGRIAGCWRALDVDLAGFITVAEYDPPSARLLASFKDWAENNYGSVVQCFKRLDADGSGLVSYSDLKRACHKTKWTGDVRRVFDCVELDNKKNNSCGQRSVHFSEVAFLDAWEFNLKDDSRVAEASEDTSSTTLPTAVPSVSSSPRTPYSHVRSSSDSALPRASAGAETPASALPSTRAPTAAPSSTQVATPTHRTPKSHGSVCSLDSTADGPELPGKESRPEQAAARPLFPLIPVARRRCLDVGRRTQTFNLGNGEVKRKFCGNLLRSPTLPGSLDALRTNTYPRQQRRPSLQEASFEEQMRLPQTPGAPVAWHPDGLVHWARPDAGAGAEAAEEA